MEENMQRIRLRDIGCEVQQRLKEAIQQNSCHDVHEILSSPALSSTDRLGCFFQALTSLPVNREIIQIFLDHGLDVNTRDLFFNETAIMHAVRRHDKALMEFLIAKGADVNLTTDDQKSCLGIAVSDYNPNNDVIKYILSLSNININHVDGMQRTPLMHAAIHANWSVMQYLIDAGADVNFRSPDGKSLGELCLGFEPRKSMEMSICLSIAMEAGMSPDVTNGTGNRSVLFKAVAKNNIFAVKALIKANCDLDFYDPIEGQTPFLLGASRGNQRVCELLSKSGCHLHYAWPEMLHKIPPNDHSFHVFIESILHNPRSLKELCRRSVRLCLGYFPVSKIKAMELPTTLIDYLLLSDVMS